MLLYPTASRRCIAILTGYIVVASVSLSFMANAAEVKVETLQTGLKAPTGVAVRPIAANGAVEVFVADRGAGRVVQADGSNPNASVEPVIVDFPVANASAGGTPCAPGVQSIFFLDPARLVAAGGDERAKPLLRLYDLTDADGVLKADEFKQDFDFAVEGGKSDSPPLCFHDLARTKSNDRVADMLVMAASTERGPSEMWKVPVRANTLGEVSAFKMRKQDINLSTAGGIAVGNGGFIVIANRAEPNTNRSSNLKYINPIDGHAMLAIEVKLPRIVALAYHPVSHNLYAASLASSDWPGGIYRIDDATEPGKPAASATKIADTARPMALAFGPDGALYVTTLGGEGSGKNDGGALLKITGEL